MTATSPHPTRTFEITVAGRTETVLFTEYGGTNGIRRWATSAPVFAARIGRGEKLYKADMTAWVFDTEDAARKAGYTRGDITVDADGTIWGVKRSTTIRNRQAYIVAWGEDYKGTTHAARHGDYSTL